MATRRRRLRFSRTFAGRRGGRRYFWLRFTPFFLTEEVPGSPGILSDLVLTQNMLLDPEASQNDTKRGAPRIERAFISSKYGVQAGLGFFANNGEANIIPAMEFMMWAQSDQFASLVQDDASFDATLENQRVLSYGMFKGVYRFQGSLTTDGNIFTLNEYEADLRAKVNMKERAVGVAIRCNQALNVTLTAYTDATQITFLVSTP